MAKRKRLTPASITGDAPPEANLETKANYPMGVAPGAVTRAPIAQVARDSATHAALDELVAEVDAARSTGRLVQDIALGDIKADHLLRDRMQTDPEEMEALKASLMARGQQTPIEVIALENGQYGLISGWRRLQATQALHAATGEARFATIQALIKPIDGVADSYVAMVEENEIRANLSFYERGRLASEAAKMGVYPDAIMAVRALFASGSRARRSKINSFVRLHDGLGAHLRFPTQIGERLGLALVKALEGDPGFAKRAGAALRKAAPADAAQERLVLERAMRGEGAAPAKDPEKDTTKEAARQVVAGIALAHKAGKITLSGKGVTDDLERDLAEWLAARAAR